MSATITHLADGFNNLKARSRDERLNQRDGDAAPVAVFCQDGNFDVYWINDAAEGELAIRLPMIGDVPAQNTLIDQADTAEGQVQVWHLTSGELQVKLNDYSFIWSDCIVSL